MSELEQLREIEAHQLASLKTTQALIAKYCAAPVKKKPSKADLAAQKTRDKIFRQHLKNAS